MTELNPGYGGPFAQKIGHVSPHDMMMQIMEENPKAKPNKIDSLFVEAVINDPELNNTCVRAFAVNVRCSIERLRENNESMDSFRKRRMERQQKTKAGAKAVYQKVKRNLLVETVRVMTFGELAALASNKYTAKLAKMGKKNEIIANVLDDTTIARVLNGK